MTAPDIATFSINKVKLVLILLVTLFLSVFGFLHLLSAILNKNSAYGILQNQLFSSTIAAISLLIFGYFSIVLVKKIFNKKATITIDINGIFNKTSLFYEQTVVWTDVTDIQITKTVFGSALFLIKVKNPEEYMQHSKSLGQRFFTSLSNKIYNTPIVLDTGSIQAKSDSISTQLVYFYEKASTQK